MSPVVARADQGDAPWIADLIARAYQNLAVSVWLVPPRGERVAILAANFRIHVEHALVHGEVHYTDDRSGVAVWLPRDGLDAPAPDDYDERLERACQPWTDRFRTLDELLAKHHPHDAHQHLEFLAVEPERQGEQLGSALLRHQHERLDAAGIAAHLEANNPANRDLYRRHGYRVGELFLLPDGGAFWPMWRDPQPPRP